MNYEYDGKLGELVLNDPLVLSNGFPIHYNMNLPKGCSIPQIEDKEYLIYSKVNLEEDLYCEGYGFLGYEIEEGVEMINDSTFIMPSMELSINAKWSASSVFVNMYGIVHQTSALYDRMEELSKNTSIVKQYTGNHNDSFSLPSTKNIYHFYAENDVQAREVLSNNNVLFADHCWQILRTTDTGGVKLIYNGEVDSNGKCGTDRGNHVGYKSSLPLQLNSSYYYGTGYNYNPITNTFSLAGDIVKETWSDITSSSLIGKYTCKLSTEDGTCTTLYLVESYINSTSANVILLNSNSHYSQFGTLQFNTNFNSPAYVGYMFGTPYTYFSKNLTKDETLLKTQSLLISNLPFSKSDYYSDSVDFGNLKNGKYTLIDPYLFTSSDDYSSLIGKYTMQSSSATSTNTYVYYIAHVSDSKIYLLKLSNGETIEDFNPMIFSDSIIDNHDGTYTLENPRMVEYKDWYSSYSEYSRTYTCNSKDITCSNPRYITKTTNVDYSYAEVNEKILISKTREGNTLTDTLLVSKADFFKEKESTIDYKYTCNTTSDTCTDDTLRMITSFNSTGYSYMENHYFGSSVTYENGKYILQNFVDIDSLTNLDDISTHHYTCLSKGEKECTEVAYVYYYTGSGIMYYITLKDGETSVNTALEKMFKGNINSSVIKTGIESWYKKYLDEYSSYLEDTIYCNDRSLNNFESSGWNENGGNTKNYLQFKEYKPSFDLSCVNQTDQFSVSNDEAKLKYPIGLATSPEINILNNAIIRKTEHNYWFGSPYYYSNNISYGRLVRDNGIINITSMNDGHAGVRPVISLKPGVLCNGGNGSVDYPYVIE